MNIYKDLINLKSVIRWKLVEILTSYSIQMWKSSEYNVINLNACIHNVFKIFVV
jgi:hypothetical protein